LDNLANLYRAMGRYAEAEKLAIQALEIQVKAVGRDHPMVANSLNNLAEIQSSLGRNREAEVTFRRALAIERKTLGPDDLVLSKTLSDLGYVYYTLGRYVEAEPFFRRAVAIREKASGNQGFSGHPYARSSVVRKQRNMRQGTLSCSCSQSRRMPAAMTLVIVSPSGWTHWTVLAFCSRAFSSA
jgi:tetratricopeptide (TPR) repeat protein